MTFLLGLLAAMIAAFILLAFGLCLYPLSERDMEGY